jgi:glycosyltransferase involved in cell wall biosynthesis
VNDAVCEACFQHKYYNCVIKKCKKGSFLPSIIAALESYIYYVLPYYKYINLFLFQSEFTRDMFVKFGYDIKKTHIIENPYDCKNITPKYEGKNYILYFGRIEKNKGIYTLLKAMESLPDIELKVVGIGTEYQNCLNYISEKRMHNVDFLGAKWNDDLMPIIENCEFVVVPSEWYEPSPYVVLQAFSYGKPVLASNMGGLNDMVKDGNNGILFNAGDDKQPTQKIKYLLSNKALTQKMGTMARKILEDKYNPERYYTDTINIFNDLIKFKNV